MDHVHICNFTEKAASVRIKSGKTYHFEFTKWGGWVSVDKNGNGSKREHPRQAWEALKEQHAPDITI